MAALRGLLYLFLSSNTSQLPSFNIPTAQRLLWTIQKLLNERQEEVVFLGSNSTDHGLLLGVNDAMYNNIPAFVSYLSLYFEIIAPVVKYYDGIGDCGLCAPS